MSDPVTNQTPEANGIVICVFCGASSGNSPAHLDAARSLARVFHENNISLVYGGGRIGVMGTLASSLVKLSGPGAVHGVIPGALVRYEQQGNLEELMAGSNVDKEFGLVTVVPDMHTRKQLMAKRVLDGAPGSGFVALSGGYGTLEELMEIITWNQLGIHKSGICVYNVDGYWDGLLAWIQNAVSAGFVPSGNAGIVVEAKTASDVITCLRNYKLAEGRFDLDWNQK